MKPPAIGARSPHLPDASSRSEPANPIYLLAAITLGIPALLMIVLIGTNPAIQAGAFTTSVTFLVVSAFVIAALFEIKRLADQPSDADHH